MGTNRRTSRPASLITLLASSVLLLSACGGGGGGGVAAGGSTDGGSGFTPTATPGSVVLRWDPSNVDVTGYTILSGPSPDLTTDVVLDVQADGVSLDPKAPAVAIHAEQDLGVPAGVDTQVCFAVQAYNYAGYSDASDAVCTTI